jgi:YHS domain-containing protein
MAKDPVCGMDVDEQSAAATSEYQGTTYFFCAPGCKRQFERDPERFVGASKNFDQQHMPEPGHGGV